MSKKSKRSGSSDKFEHTIVGDEIDDATFEKMASSMRANHNNDESASDDEAGSLSVSDLIALGRAKKTHLKSSTKSSTLTDGLPAKRRATSTSSVTNIRNPKTNKVYAHDKEWWDS